MTDLFMIDSSLGVWGYVVAILVLLVLLVLIAKSKNTVTIEYKPKETAENKDVNVTCEYYKNYGYYIQKGGLVNKH